MHSAPHELLRNKNCRIVNDFARHEVDCQAKLARERRVVVKRHSARALVQVGVGLKHDRAHDRDVLFLVVLEDGGELTSALSSMSIPSSSTGVIKKWS